MGNRRSQENATSAAEKLGDANGAEQCQGQPAASTSSASLIPSAEDAQTAHSARRSQLREDDGRDPPEQEHRRLESIAAKSAAREASRAAALAAQSAEWRSFGPAQRLFTDGIASCLSFLSLADFNSAARSCKSWRVGAHAVHSLGQSTLSTSVSVLPSLFSSPFRRLVKSFQQCDYSIDCDNPAAVCTHVSCGCGAARLKGLYTLSSLTDLYLRLDLAKLVGAPIQYPRRLAAAWFGLGCSASMSGRTFNAAVILHGLAACARLTRLTLELVKEQIALSGLGALKQLRHLDIDGHVELHYTPATLHVIKTLPRLETLELYRTGDPPDLVDDFGPEWLAPLLSAPHRLQTLESLIPGWFSLWDNDFCMRLLPPLTALTRLQSQCTSILALPVLAAFTELQSLHLAFDGSIDSKLHDENDEIDAAYDDHGFARLSVLVPHLAVRSLTDLSLSDIVCDDESLTALCKSQPLLESLELDGVALTTVQPLGALPGLSHLSVKFAAHADPPLGLFEQLCACKSLQQLQLWYKTPALSQAQQQQLRPPSTVLPLLTWLDYSRAPDADLA